MLAELLIELDMALTGKDRRTAEHTARNQAERFLETRMYYLSDGGYSRVAMNWEGDRMWLTSNSLDRTMQAWSRPDVQQIVTAIFKQLAVIAQ